MTKIVVEATDIIHASPQVTYNVLADYQVGHKAILPKPFFKGMDVLEGGRGAGTRVKVYMAGAMGRTRTMEMVASEPEPGHILMERDQGSDLVTTFTVEPVNDGTESRVTIKTVFSARNGISGMAERIFNPSMMRYVFKVELRKLDKYAQDKKETGSRAFG